MNERTERRNELGLTQSSAAAAADVSLATWRRWEEDAESVSLKTRAACERVLASESAHTQALAKSAAAFETAWGASSRLTPRQAYSIAMTLDVWADSELREWLQHPDEPLHEVSPFDRFDMRVMMLVGESRAWVQAVRARCYAVSDEIEGGTLPFDRPGAFVDEVLIGAALPNAEAYLSDMPELFDRISPRAADEGRNYYVIGDEDWDIVSDGFDDVCRWDEWEVPLRPGHPLLPPILAERHPFTWFDRVPESGPGYLQRLAGLVVDDVGEQDDSEM